MGVIKTIEKNINEIKADRLVLNVSNDPQINLRDRRNGIFYGVGVVMYRDIISFRKTSRVKPIVKSLILIGSSIGSYFYFNSKNVSETENIIYSTPVGLGVGVVVKLTFDNGKNNKMSDGWKISLK